MARLFKQTYQEFASQGLEKMLEPIGIVTAFGGNREYDYAKSIISVNEDLNNNAESLGATHVFGVEYQLGVPSSPRNCIFAYGDAYKPKQKTPYRD